MAAAAGWLFANRSGRPNGASASLRTTKGNGGLARLLVPGLIAPALPDGGSWTAQARLLPMGRQHKAMPPGQI